MATAKTVKARTHVGAASLDLTIPVDVCRAYKLSPGDVWSVVASREGGRVVVKYVRVQSVDGGQ